MTKKLLPMVIALLAAVALPLQAATNYGINIGGVSVTSDNAYNVTGGGISTIDGGKITYNASTNTLTLKGTYVDCQKHNGIRVETSAANGLRIVLEDDNYFYNINGVAMAIYHPKGATYSSPNVYIQGTGTLTFPKGQGDIATSDQAYLCIGNGVQGGAGGGGCTINADAIYSMKDSQGNRGGYLGITDACVNLRGFSYGTVYGFSYVYNNGTDMGYLPEGAYYNTSSNTGDYYYLADSSGKKLTGEVKMGWKRYGLTVGGVDVHAKNYTNIRGLAISGTVSYSPSSKQLNLNNATIDIRKRLDWTECIVNYGENLTVNVTGTCTITRGNTSQGQDNRPTITSAKNLTFQGSGSLTIDNYQGYGILMGSGGQTLAFNKVENFKVNGYGIDMSQGTLSLNASSVKTYDVLQIGNLKMTDTEFENTKTIWDPNQKTIRYHYSNNRPSNISFKKVTTKYYVYIAGHMLNDVNANNFYYYNTSGTLTAEFMGTNNSVLSITMEDFTADAEGNDNLIAEGGGCPADILIITSKGNNELKNPSATAIYHYKSLWIGGDGTLNIDGEISTCQGAELHILNCTLLATRLAALDASSKLSVSDAHVLLSGKGDGTATISGFKSFSTVSCAITTPAGAYYDESGKQLVDADGYCVTGEVEIEQVEYYDLKIMGTYVSSLNCHDIPLDPALAGDYSGTVSYDPETNVLTIDNLSADYLTIEEQSDRDVLFIQLNGQSKLKGDFYIISHGIRTNSLPLTWVNGDAPGNNSSIKCDRLICESSLILFCCQVEGSRLLYESPVASTQSNPQLLIQNSHVSLSGSPVTTAYTLGGFAEFMLEEGSVVKPENWNYDKGYVYNVNDYCLYDGTGACNMAVEIRPDGWQAEGDVNGDGQVGIGDIVAITNVMAGIETDTDIKARADVNGDGDVGIGDIVAITNIMAGL